MLRAPTGRPSPGDILVRIIKKQYIGGLQMQSFGEPIKKGPIRFAGTQIRRGKNTIRGHL